MEPSETSSPFDTEANETQPDPISEDELIQAVITEINISAEELDALIQQQADEFKKAEDLISGVSYCLDPATGVLHIQHYPSMELIQSIPLIQNQQSFFDDSSSPQFAIQEWEPWATSICCVNPHHGAIEGFIHLDQDAGYGLVLTAHNSFLFSHDPYHADILGQSLQCLYHRVHKSGQGQTCFDMHVSEDRQYLSIGDRHAGCLYLFDAQQHQLLGKLQIRKPGSLKAINVAFDYYEPRLFVTDNQSSKLTMIQLPDLMMEAIPLSFGEEEEDIGLGPVFGNLVKAPDIRYVYALSFKPNKAILASINIEMNEIEGEITLKGQFFSQQQMDACDLMVLSPDQNLMLILTSYHEPYPFTPGVSVIDPHELKPLRFHVIPNALIEQLKPTMLVFAIPNPVRNLRKTPLELLISKGHITAYAIEELKQKLIQRKLEGPAEIVVVDIDDPDGPSHGQGPVPALEPQAADQITLKPELAIPAILFVLRKKLYQQTELDLEALPTELERFKELAEAYRQQLESFDSVEVLIENINRKHTLETYLSRQDILSLIASQGFRNQEIARPPMHCPSCHSRLKGNWDCPVCFLELESPNRRLKKLRSSLDSLGAVSPYHLLMADPKRKRLLVLDDHKTIDWSLMLHELGIPSVLLQLCRHFWQALCLPNQNILVVDRKGHNVFETSPKGQITWALNQETHPEFTLKKPVKATYFTDPERDWFLIVDQGNHRVLVVSRKQQLIFEYGVNGQPGYEDGFLSSPSDIQLTDEDTYLICDSGNHRVIEVQEQWVTPGQEPVSVAEPEGGEYENAEYEKGAELERVIIDPNLNDEQQGSETPEEFAEQALIESLVEEPYGESAESVPSEFWPVEPGDGALWDASDTSSEALQNEGGLIPETDSLAATEHWYSSTEMPVPDETTLWSEYPSSAALASADAVSAGSEGQQFAEVYADPDQSYVVEIGSDEELGDAEYAWGEGGEEYKNAEYKNVEYEQGGGYPSQAYEQVGDQAAYDSSVDDHGAYQLADQQVYEQPYEPSYDQTAYEQPYEQGEYDQSYDQTAYDQSAYEQQPYDQSAYATGYSNETAVYEDHETYPAEAYADYSDPATSADDAAYSEYAAWQENTADVIPAPSDVIPAPSDVIPAKAGIQNHDLTDDVDPRVKPEDDKESWPEDDKESWPEGDKSWPEDDKESWSENDKNWSEHDLENANEDKHPPTAMAYAMPTDSQDEQYPTLKLSLQEALDAESVDSESAEPEKQAAAEAALDPSEPAASEDLSALPSEDSSMPLASESPEDSPFEPVTAFPEQNNELADEAARTEYLPEGNADDSQDARLLDLVLPNEELIEQTVAEDMLSETLSSDQLGAETSAETEPEPISEEDLPPAEPYKKTVIVRQFGRKQGLNNPVFAQRLLNRDTLIVDAGNYRVIEVDPDGEIVSECFYFSADMPDDMRIDAPRQFIRREKKSVVLMDNDKVVEILPLKKKLIWSSMFKHLSRRVEILRDAFDKKDSYVQSFHQYRMPTLEELLNRLRAENRLGSSSGIAERLFESLKQLIEERRQRDAERDKQSQVKIYDEGHLQNIPIFLIDRSNQQILQINRQGQPVWYFGNTPQYKLMRPNHMTQTGSSLLLADTNHNRIIEVELADHKVIQVIGEDPKHNLAKPRSAYRTLAGHTLVTDQGHRRLVEFDENGQQVWEFNKPREISYPFFAMESGKDTILFVDLALHMVKEITREGQLIWTYGQSSRMGSEDNQLASPEYAVPLHTGAILIADTGNHRIIEVSPKRKILWEFVGNSKYTLVKPNWCQRLSNGNTLIAYQSYRCLLEVNREGEACWYFELGTEALGRG